MRFANGIEDPAVRKWGKFMKRLLLMVQFLTRLPVPITLDVETEDFEKGIVYFPVVGLILGVLLFGTAKMLQPFMDALTLSVIIVFLEVLLTGGLHLDGLADSFDGLFSYRDKERMLEIMKDSRIGSNGVLVLIFALLFKFVMVHALLESQWLMPLLLMPVLSRGMSVFASHISQYARPSGMGNFFIGKVNRWQLGIGLGFSALILVLFAPTLWWLLPLMMLTTAWFCRFCTQKIDGMTGDTLGANTELQELLVLVAAVVYIYGLR